LFDLPLRLLDKLLVIDQLPHMIKTMKKQKVKRVNYVS